MTRNQKIALGCGGAGCLGLIVVTVAGCLIYFFAYRQSQANRTSDYDYNSNRTAKLNSNANDDADDSTNSSSSSNSSSTAGSLSDDERHRLFQAAAMTRDTELQRRVWVKIGIMDEDFSQGDKFGDFARDHIGWVIRNYQWVSTIDSPEKARAYVDEHLP